jgi:hypothetical protein
MKTSATILVTAILAGTQAALAHGIAGNRYFDGTLTFDDPAVADEAILPLYGHSQYPTQDSNVVENRLNWSFARLLTPTLAFTADSGWIHQKWPIGRTSGADKADIGLKYEAFRDNRHEALVSASLMGHRPQRFSGRRGRCAPHHPTRHIFRQGLWRSAGYVVLVAAFCCDGCNR